MTAGWLASVVAGPVESPDASPIQIASRLELAVDPRWIDQMKGLQLRQHSPQPREIVLRKTGGNGYMTVLKDGPVYRMYYRYIVPSDDPDGHEFYCYAESRDGIHWIKPDLGLFDIPGTDERNAITEENKARPGDDDPDHFPCVSHNLRPFLDYRSGVVVDERYKALGGGYNSGSSNAGYWALVSGDGIHWRKLCKDWVIDRSNWPHGSDSTPACVFWSEAEEKYVAYIRIRVNRDNPTIGQVGGLRWIGRITSADFIRWSKVTPMRPMSSAGPDAEKIAGRSMHYYTNETQPYYRNPHLYVATPARFFVGTAFRRDQIGQLPEEMKSYPPDAAGAGYTDAILLTTRPGRLDYRRPFAEAFLRPGLDVRSWGNRSTYPNVNLVPTSDSEMSFYVRHGAAAYGYIQRYALRADGFASVAAPLEGGELITRPLLFDRMNGEVNLQINYSTSGAGSVRIEIQDVHGNAVPGLALADAEPNVGDAIDQPVRWQSGSNVSRLAGTPLRLRIVMHDADLYSFRFQ